MNICTRASQTLKKKRLLLFELRIGHQFAIPKHADAQIMDGAILFIGDVCRELIEVGLDQGAETEGEENGVLGLHGNLYLDRDINFVLWKHELQKMNSVHFSLRVYCPPRHHASRCRRRSDWIVLLGGSGTQPNCCGLRNDPWILGRRAAKSGSSKN